MYRLRLDTGREVVYRTADELAVGIRAGLVSGKAQVFHKAGNRWLPIEMHPDYRAVVSGKYPDEAPRSRLAASCKHPGEAPKPAVELAPASPEPEPQTLSVPESTVPPVKGIVQTALDGGDQVESLPGIAEVEFPLAAPGQGQRPIRMASPGSRTRIAMYIVIAGAAMVAIAALATWHLALPRLERHRAGTARSEGMPPRPVSRVAPGPPEVAPRESPPTVYPAPSEPLPLDAEGGSGEPTLATRTSRLRATLNREPSYFEAYADARAEMDEGLAYISFRSVFDPARFASPESLRAVRRTIAAAGNILRVYRGREVMLEQTYRPDDPGGRRSLRERFATAEATRGLLSDVDSLLGVLVSQQARFSYRGQALRFQDPVAAVVYGDLRQRIMATIRAWRDSAPAQDLVTMPRLLRALGELPPPAQR